MVGVSSSFNTAVGIIVGIERFLYQFVLSEAQTIRHASCVDEMPPKVKHHSMSFVSIIIYNNSSTFLCE